ARTFIGPPGQLAGGSLRNQPTFILPPEAEASPRMQEAQKRDLERVPEVCARQDGDRRLATALAREALAVAADAAVDAEREVGVHLVPLETDTTVEVEVRLVGIGEAVDREHVLLGDGGEADAALREQAEEASDGEREAGASASREMKGARRGRLAR